MSITAKQQREGMAQPIRGSVGFQEAIEQAEKQEPIGYFTINDYDKWEEIDGTLGKSLYEAPQPQREWVGLTDEERAKIWNAPENFERAMNFAVAIEAKLKENNT
jgi:hypothetical protein